MLNRMLRYADAIVKRGVDKLIDAIGQSAEPQSENTETPQSQKSMDKDTDCTPEVQRRDMANKGLVPVSKLVRNTMVTAPFDGAGSDEVRRMWCSMRFAANAKDIRTKGQKNKDITLVLAANAENIRTKEHKNKSASRHTGMDLRPCALKNIRATP